MIVSYEYELGMSQVMNWLGMQNSWGRAAKYILPKALYERYRASIEQVQERNLRCNRRGSVKKVMRFSTFQGQSRFARSLPKNTKSW